jgi:Uma2 family endonuclease
MITGSGPRDRLKVTGQSGFHHVHVGDDLMSHAPTQRRAGEPAWEIAELFPEQGGWSVQEYFDLSDRNRLVEYSHGFVEVLPMPTFSHQLIVAFLYRALVAWASQGDRGTVLFAPYRIRVEPQTYREPDIVFFLHEHDARPGEQFSDGADLVMEVVSDSNRSHDLEKKRAEYAAAGIPEYWIVDPKEGRILVLVLEQGATTYVEHGSFGKGERAISRLLPGLVVDVSEALEPRR